VSLDSLDWSMEEGTWAGLVSDVRSLRIMGEFINGSEDVRLDNVGLSFTPGYVWYDCVAETFSGSDTGDWSFSGTGGVSNPGNYGNGGGYCHVDDSGSYNSYGFAPSRFLGEWTPLDGSGLFTIDIRVISGSGTNGGSAEFVRLSGPGGVAHVSLDPSELPTAKRVWKTFTYPIDSSVWQLDSGTWTGLLSDVTELRIDLEYFSGTDDIGFDNVGRLVSTCPDVDDPVALHDPAWEKCGYHSFVECRAVARSPVNGVLYSTVRAAVGSGGGLYTASGPNPGVLQHSYDRPADVQFDCDGNAFVSEDYAGDVHRLTPAGVSSVWVSDFHGGDDDPWGMTVAPPGFNGPNVTEGDFIVSDRGSGGADQFWTFSPTVPEGELLLVPDPGTVDFFDLTATTDTLVYTMDALDGTNIYKIGPSGGLVQAAPGFQPYADLGSVLSIVCDTENGDLYAASNDSACIYRIEPGAWDVTKVADGFSDLLHCCLEIDPEGRRLWVADNGYSRIYEICLEGAVGVDEPDGLGSERVSALAIHPNPANPTVTIEFALVATESVTLEVFDVSGRKVRSLLSTELPAGTHSERWDGMTEDGRRAASGVYFVVLRTKDGTRTGKTVLLR